MHPVRHLRLLALAPLAALSSASPGRVAAIGDMRVARASHTATPLPDGRVLIAGGFAGSGGEAEPYASTEIYDPAAGAFTEGPTMHVCRSGHTATVLRDGRVLLAGGWTGRYRASNTAEVYDARTGRLTPTGPLAAMRADQTATLLADGRVLLAGGFDPDMRPLATAEIYDPATNRFTPTGSLTYPRGAHTATLLADGRVLVVGGGGEGRYPNRAMQGEAELYDPARGTFVSAGHMLVSRHKHAAVRLTDGSVLVVGGSDGSDWRGQMASAERWIPATGRFVAAGRMALARFKLPGAVVALRDGRVVVAGGGDRAEVYYPADDQFALTDGSLGAARFYAAAAPLRDGAVLVTGGYAESHGELPATKRAFVFLPR